MGKGDLKTKRGKIVRGTYGKRRPRKKVSAASTVTETKKVKKEKTPKKETAKPKAKKTTAKKTTIKKETTEKEKKE